MTIQLLSKANLIAIPNMRSPLQGAQGASFLLDFTGSGTLEGNLESCFQSGEFDFVQSVYIDNLDNASTLTLTFPGTPPNGHRITAQPYSQGWYAICVPVGDPRFVAVANAGQTIKVIFANVAMPYSTWGPLPGVLVVPALTNKAVSIIGASAGNNLLVAGVAAQTIKVYRSMLTVTKDDVYGFRSNATDLGSFDVGVYGSMTFQPSGVPWFTTAVAEDLNINAVVGGGNIRGVLGYVQS